MRMPPLLADFIYHGACKPICEKSLTLPKGMEVLQMFRRKAEKRMVELSPDEARLLREALLAFRNKLLSAGKPTEDVNELIIKVMK